MFSAYGLPFGGRNGSARRELLAGGDVELPQPAVPRDRVDRVLAGRVASGTTTGVAVRPPGQSGP